MKINSSKEAVLNMNSYNEHQKSVLDSVAVWAGYYRSNPHRFAEEFLHINLTWFQKLILFMINIVPQSVFIACRGIGKTFLFAIYCVFRCVLYPGTKICVVAGTKGQAGQVLLKIMQDLKPNSPELAYEIDEKNTTLNGNNAIITFLNTSTIKVVAANDNARSNRAHILFVDEFRMVKKSIMDTVLKKFLANPRHPKFMDLPEYKGKKEYKEPLQTIYSSSGYYKDHWCFIKTKDVAKLMLGDALKGFVCGCPWQLAVAEGIITEDIIVEQMMESDFNEITWMMEMEALFWGDSDGAFFSFESMAKNRRIKYPMLPSNLTENFADNTLKIKPKAAGEKRLLSIDVALMSSKKNKNDASSLFITQLVPTKAGRYSVNVIYPDVWEGKHTQDQALLVRRLFDEYDCNYIVLDCKGVGMGIYDALVRDIPDNETGEIYPALSCCNNPELADRCENRDARKVIWAIQATAKFNSDCAMLLREGFRAGRIGLLSAECDAEESLTEIKGYKNLSQSEKNSVLICYINTTLLIDEMINLQHQDNNGLIKIFEKSGRRKDRYSSLSYNYYVACQLERKIKKESDDEFNIDKVPFMYRAPKIK